MTSIGGLTLTSPITICSECSCIVPSPQIELENDHCWFVRKPQPVLRGSGIILPKKHRETVFELERVEWEATREMLLAAKDLIDHELSPAGYNIGWNCGSAAGQHREHLHLHVIPRFDDEPHAGKGIRWWLNQEDNRRPSYRGSLL